MAEYAGLEIRIGGNTTKLTNALKASTKSAAELQRNIRQITRAMQFDPTDLKNIETRIKLTGDRMESLQSKAQLVRTAMGQLGDTMVRFRGDDRSIRDIATGTENLTLAAKQADERFNNLTGSLAEVYEAWNRLARDKGVDFARDRLGIDAKTAGYLMSASTSLRDFRTELNNINSARQSGLVEGDIITPGELARLQQFKDINFHAMFENGLGLDEVVEDARNLGIAISEDAVGNVRELQMAFKDAQEEKKGFDDALKFEQMGTDLQRINSEAEGLSQTMRTLDDSVNAVSRTPWFQSTEADLRKVDAALDNVERDLERTEAAMKVDPKNIGLAARYMNDLQQKVSLSEEKATLLNREMQLLKTDGAKEAAKNHEDLAKWIEESAENARVAKKALSDQSAEVANLEDSVKKASQSLATMKRDMTLAEMSDNVQKLAKKTDDLATANERLAGAQATHKKNADALADVAAKYTEAEKNVEAYKKQIEALEQEQRECVKVMDDASASADDAFAAFGRANEIDNELSNLKTKLSDAQVDMENFAKKVREADSRLDTSATSVRDYTRDIDGLNREIDKLSKTKEVKLLDNPHKEIAEEEAALEGLKADLEQAKATEKERQAAYNSAAAENNLAKEAKSYQDLSQKAEEAKVGMKEAQEAMSLQSSKILNASTVKSIGMTLSATLTPALVGVGYSMIDVSSDVDAAYRDMRKTVDGTEEQFEQLRSAAIDFSRTHVTSAEQILQIEAIGGELGVATESLQTFAEVISNLDVATNLDTEGAANALGHLANIMHLSEDDYVSFSDALVRLGNNGASTETEIVNIAERIGSMAAIVGMSASDTLAFASSVASTGQNAEAAGTAISKTLGFMETAVAAAGGTLDTSFEAINAAVQNGGDELTVFANLAGQTAEEFAEAWDTDSKGTFEQLKGQVDSAKDSLQGIADVAHMSADEFAKTWESDPTTALKAFIEGLNDLEGAGGSADAVLQGLGITSVRQKQAIEGLMQTVGGLDDNLKMSEDAWNGVSDKWGVAGDAANEAAKKAEGFSGQVQILKNIWQNFLAELGEGAVPIIKSVTGTIEGLSKWFSGLGKSAKTTVVLLGGVTAALGPMLSIGATAATSTKELKEWFDGATSGINLVKMAAKHGGKAITEEMANNMSTMGKLMIVGKSLGATLLKGLAVAGVVAGIIAIGVALKNLYDRYQDHIAATKGLSDAISNIGKESEVTVDSVDVTGTRLRELAEDAKGYESRLADLAHTIEESNSQYSNYAGTLSYYGDTVKELAGKEGRTKDESAKLAAALSGINEACGTTYAIDEFGNIIDTQTGKIQDNTDAIFANLDARRAQAVMEYYSDDYAKAVGEMQAANDKLAEAKEYYKSLQTEEGKNKFFEDSRKKYGDRYSDSEINAAYQAELRDTQTAIRDFSEDADGASEAVSNLEAKMDIAQAEMEKANRTLDDAAEKERQYQRRTDIVTADVTGNMKRMSDAVTELGGDDSAFNDMVDGLSAISVSAKELNDVDMGKLASAFSSVGGSMDQVIQALVDGGVQLDTWNAALEAAPGAAENMSGLTAAAFDSMYEIAGQDLNDTMLLVAGLDMMQVGDKTFYIGDNGSVVDSEGKIYDLKTQLDELPPEVVTLINGDNSDAQSKISETENSRRELDGKQARVGIYANNYASGTISSVKDELNRLHGRSATTNIYVVRHELQATGGMNNRPVIPKHATGYIATGPTLTNQGWIGEDGVEAVANWATGGAVVPLTNKKYMLPIADAIAEGMSQRLGYGSGTTYNTYINDAIVNSDEEIQTALLALLTTLQRKGAMNRG